MIVNILWMITLVWKSVFRSVKERQILYFSLFALVIYRQCGGSPKWKALVAYAGTSSDWQWRCQDAQRMVHPLETRPPNIKQPPSPGHQANDSKLHLY